MNDRKTEKCEKCRYYKSGERHGCFRLESPMYRNADDPACFNGKPKTNKQAGR